MWPKKAYVSLRRAGQFAMLGPGTRGRFEVGINSKDLEGGERLVAQPARGMCQFTVWLTTLEEVTLAVGVGSFTIELLGDDDAVTLTLEARDGQTVSGQGQCVLDVFGDARYRVTAVEAENVDYRMDYRFQ